MPKAPRPDLPALNLRTASERFRPGVDRLFPLLLIFLCFVLGFSRLRVGIDTTDEGILAYGAERVTQGQLPNRDFASLQPPLSFYTAAIMYKLLGTSLLSLRVLGFGIYIALPLLIYGIARTMIGPALSFAAALPATVLGIPLSHFVPFAPWQGVTASAAAVLLYLWAVRRNSLLCGALAGFMTLTAMLCRHDQGVYVALSILAYTLALKCAVPIVPKGTLARVLGGWGIGIFAGIFPWAVYWGIEGAIPAMFQQLVVYFATTYVKTNGLPFPHFSADVSLARNLVVALFYLPPLAGLLAAIWLWRRFRDGRYGLREAGMTLILVWTELFFCQILGRTDVYHLLISQAPFFILSACLWAMALESGAPKMPFSIAAAVALAGCLILLKPLFLRNEGPLQEAPLARAGVRFERATEMAELVKRVQHDAPPDRSILCLSYQPLLYFLCERRNPTRWNYLWPGDETAADQRTFVAEARHDPPAVVLITDETNLAGFAPIVLNYVHEDFRKTSEFGGISFYLPK
jgi:hypothetical protein